jgi:hypothetical protein
MNTGLSLSSFTGTIFGREVDAAGVPLAGANFLDLGEVYPLEVQVASKEVKGKSRKVATAGQVIGAKAEIDDISGSMTLRQWNAFNLARFFSGVETKLTGTGGTMTPAEFTAPLPGQWIYVGHKGFTSFTVTSSPAGTTYVLGTDYEYNAALGLFTSVTGGALAAGTVDVLIGGDYAAESGYRIEIGTRAQTRMEIQGELYNEFSGAKHTVEFDCVQLTSSKAVNLVSEAGSEGEFLEFSLSFITIPGQTSPGRVDGVPM